jgi:hypothetical protein
MVPKLQMHHTKDARPWVGRAFKYCNVESGEATSGYIGILHWHVLYLRDSPYKREWGEER